jgi:Na+-translocating ferredoxin:NAD+ oxidoreductase RnfA subunit
MSFEGVSKRVEMSMSLTAANEIVNWLSIVNAIDSWTLSKMAILFTVVLVYIDSACTSTQPTGMYAEREGIIKVLGITRQISILAVAR